MPDWHNYFLICHDACMMVPREPKGTQSFEVASAFYPVLRVNKSRLCIYPTSALAQAVRMV